MWQEYDVHGYIIVYSITDRRSYQKAADVLTSIRYRNTAISTAGVGCSRPIILVANKSDLERSRMIGKEGLPTDSVYSKHLVFFGGGGDSDPPSPPEKNLPFPQTAAKLYSPSLFFGRDNEFQIGLLQVYHGNVLSMDNKHGKFRH